MLEAGVVGYLLKEEAPEACGRDAGGGAGGAAVDVGKGAQIVRLIVGQVEIYLWKPTG
jgi:hypothetical protein